MRKSSTITEVVHYLDQNDLRQAMGCLELVSFDLRKDPRLEISAKNFFERALLKGDLPAAKDIAWSVSLSNDYVEEHAEAAAKNLDKSGDTKKATEIRELFLPVRKYVMDQTKVKQMLRDSFLAMAQTSDFDAFGRPADPTFYNLKNEKALPATIADAMTEVVLLCLQNEDIGAALGALQESPEINTRQDVQNAARVAYKAAVERQWEIAEDIKTGFKLE